MEADTCVPPHRSVHDTSREAWYWGRPSGVESGIDGDRESGNGGDVEECLLGPRKKLGRLDD